MEEKASTDNKKLYHERQVKELCALHALNNLFQTKQAFTKKELDEICNRLSPGSFINPHRSMLGVGNYDVNVLMAALQEKGFETIWFDKRKDVDVLIMENIMGLILNTPTDYKLGFMKLPIHRKHWIAIKCLQGQYMNLDSKLDAPSPIGDEKCLLQYLRCELSNGEKELLLVVEPDVYEKSLWRRDTNRGDSATNIHSTNNENSDETIEKDIPHGNDDHNLKDSVEVVKEIVPPNGDEHNMNNVIDHMDNLTMSVQKREDIKNQHVPMPVKSEDMVNGEISQFAEKIEKVS